MLTKKFFFKLFNVKLIYSIQVLGPWLWGNKPFFSSVVGQRKGPSGANAPPVHGIKKCLESFNDPKDTGSNILNMQVVSKKVLGIIIDDQLRWDEQIDNIIFSIAKTENKFYGSHLWICCC
jgi:hypothetical protein